MEYQNLTNFKKLKAQILCNFKHDESFCNQLIKSAGTIFINHNTKDICEKKVENRNRKRENITRNNINQYLCFN